MLTLYAYTASAGLWLFFLVSQLSLDWRSRQHPFGMLPSRNLAQTRLYRFLRKELTMRF